MALLLASCSAAPDAGNVEALGQGPPPNGAAGDPAVPGLGAEGSASASGSTDPGGAALPGDPSGSAAPPLAPLAFEPAPGGLRRLTSSQFRNALRDALGASPDAIGELDPDSYAGGFAVVGAARVVTSERGVEQYQSAVEAVVASVFADPVRRDTLIGCTLAAGAEDACLREFLSAFGRRVWRRPLLQSELDTYADLASRVALELGTAEEGVRYAIVALLISPNFLYRRELGEPAADGSGSFVYSDYEQASRLAFLLWNSLPDDELLEAAARGELKTSEGRRSAAIRLLAAEPGRASIGGFAFEWLRLDRLQTQAKDLVLFPEYTPTLQRAMAEDVRLTFEALAFDANQSALELFTTESAFVNSELAALYGLSATGLDLDSVQAVNLPSDGPRVGLLGKPGFLSQFANQKEGSPTLRGKFIREQLLCTRIPDPPPNISTMLVEPPAGTVLTKRELLEQHRNNPSCSVCHNLMDPLGLPLESFDAIGRFRTLDRGLPIDLSGELDGQAVDGARTLGEALSQSEVVAQCLARRYYSYSLGIEERPVDRSMIEQLSAAFEASGYQLRDLVLEAVSSPAFALVAPAVATTTAPSAPLAVPVAAVPPPAP